MCRFIKAIIFSLPLKKSLAERKRLRVRKSKDDVIWIGGPTLAYGYLPEHYHVWITALNLSPCLTNNRYCHRFFSANPFIGGGRDVIKIKAKRKDPKKQENCKEHYYLARGQLYLEDSKLYIIFLYSWPWSRDIKLEWVRSF